MSWQKYETVRSAMESLSKTITDLDGNPERVKSISLSLGESDYITVKVVRETRMFLRPNE